MQVADWVRVRVRVRIRVRVMGRARVRLRLRLRVRVRLRLRVRVRVRVQVASLQPGWLHVPSTALMVTTPARVASTPTLPRDGTRSACVPTTA